MKWYEITFYIMGVIGFFIGLMAWFDVRPADIRHIIEKIGGLLNARIVLILLLILFLFFGSLTVFATLRAKTPLYLIMPEVVIIIVSTSLQLYALHEISRYK